MTRLHPEDVTRGRIPTWSQRLAQDEVWHNSQGVPVPLVVMDRQYRVNVLNWLARHAKAIAQTVLWQLMFTTPPRGEAAMDSLESIMDRLAQDPLGWLTETPLFQALLGDDLGRVHGGPTREEFATWLAGVPPWERAEPGQLPLAWVIPRHDLELRIEALVEALECWCPDSYLQIGTAAEYCPRHATGPKLTAAILELIRD